MEPRHSGRTKGFDALTAKDWSSLSLHELLSQPVIISQGVGVSDFTLAFRSHSGILDASPFHLEKIKGYVGIRATVVVRLVVNADKYTQGRLCLAHQPLDLTDTRDLNDHRLITQLPHVELDLNTDTEVTLRIPHRGPYTHFDIANRRFDPGLFRIRELLPFRGTPFSYTVYASFEDLHLLGPTAPTTVTYQSGLSIEEKNVPLSTKVKGLASAMVPFEGVPVIGSYITPMAWATAVAGNVLSAFGWSKPLCTETPEVFINRGDAKYNHSDGRDYAEQLAVTTTTGVRATDQIGLTEEDEMSMPYLLGISSTLYRFNYGITTTSGTKLYTVALCPLAMQAASSVTGAGLPHPMAYIANCFNLYRGSITMTVDLAKTIFHSGRIMVVFEPIVPDLQGGTNFPVSRVNTIDDAINCHKDIVDIRKGSTFSFTFPFTSLVPYLPVEAPYGYVHIFVVNQLVRNDTAVSDLIDVALKFKGEPDFEFSAPTIPRFWPYREGIGATTVNINDSTVDGTGDPVPTTIPGVSYESGLEVGDSVIVNKPIGSSSPSILSHELSQLCQGEQIRSLKQLAMRMKLVYPGGAGGRTPKFPFAVDIFQDAALGQPVNTYSPFFDFYSYVGALYRYARGGVILNVENPDGTQALNVSMKSDSSNWPTNGANLNAEFGLRGCVYSERTERFYLPPYDPSIVHYVAPSPLSGGSFPDNPPDLFYSFGYNRNRLQFTAQNTGLNTTNYRLSRSAAEDTQFGGFTACPLLVLRAPYNNLNGGPGGTEWKVLVANDLSFPES